MTTRSTSLRYPEGTKTVGTARVREDKTVGRSFAERELMRRTGNAPHSTFDEVADGVADKGLTTLAGAIGAERGVPVTDEELAVIHEKRKAETKLVEKLMRPTKPIGPREAAKKALQALGRLKAGAMNKTEAAYAAHLEGLKQAGKIAWFRFEGMKFRLADNTFYTPDFAVMLSGGQLECHEVKGHWQDDARVKIKIVADQYPLKFIAVTAKSKKAGGGWQVEEF